jgi:3-phenylpropionate/cinnamic acid dioxygenase small subunit
MASNNPEGYWVKGLCRIEVLYINRDKNSVYVAKYSEDATFVTNDEFKLDAFEKHAGVKLVKEDIVLYVKPCKKLGIG